MTEIIRRVRLSPYRKGQGPRFTLVLWDTGRYDARGQTYLGYRLTSSGTILAKGEDFSGSPLHADDSDATVLALIHLLCYDESLDSDSILGYHSEALSFEADQRFSKENQ